MKVEHHVWHSPRLGREMGIRVYGHWGPPMLVFPTSGGDEWEFEGQGMISALGHHIDARQDQAVLRQLGQQPELVRQGRPPAPPLLRAVGVRRVRRRRGGAVRPRQLPVAGHRDHHDGRVVRRVPRRQQPAEAPAAVPALPGALRRLRPAPLHGRRLRRQLLLQQPRRLRGEPRATPGTSSSWRRTTSASSPATARSRTRAPPTSCPGCCGRAASATRWTTGGPTAATTGPTGRSSSTSTSRRLY